MANVFISYRRSDAEGWAGRLSDSLKANLGRLKIFRDIDDIPPGVDFDAYIIDSVSSCNALIVLIGPHWLVVTDKIGKRRLDDPTDLIRLEIATALKRDIRVIPVLVGGAEIPSADDLPEDLKPLARRQAYGIADTHWAADCKQLAGVLKPLVRPATGIGRKTIVSLGLIVFLAIGGILMKQWRDRDLESALELQSAAEKAAAEKEMLQKEHENGFLLIQGAAEKASLTCRELREIDLKRQNLEIAKGLGDTGLVNSYTTQIEEIAQNIRDHASEYKDLIGRLVGIKKPVAEAEFEHYANELLGKKSFDQVHVSRLVQRHYQNHLDGASAENIGLTRETCIEE